MAAGAFSHSHGHEWRRGHALKPSEELTNRGLAATLKKTYVGHGYWSQWRSLHADPRGANPRKPIARMVE
jgi:hypothetical protein